MMRRVRLACCIVALLATSAQGDEISLVRVGEVWRYFRGTNEPSSPVTDWRQLSFEDSSWLKGESGFSTTGYSGTGEATYWSQSAPASLTRSFYLRRKFTVADPQAVKWLVLRLDYTHGFVAYLNGQEIARRGLTNNPVAHDDYADYHAGGAAEEFDVSALSGLLNAGENVLAIQVHTAITNLSGYDSSMRLVPELLANFQRGPFLANVSTNSAQVIWRTPVAATSVVDFGTNQAMGSVISDAALTTNHVLTLTDLLPGTEYFYRIRSTADVVTAVSPVLSFHTFKPSGDFTFLVTADGGDGAAAKYRVASLMAQSPADLVLHCGDSVYDYFAFGREDYRCLSAYGSQMRSVPFYFSMGNHEVDGPSFEQPCLQTLYLPTNPATGTEHFYSFDQGDAHFTVLFVPWLKQVPEYAPFQLTNGSAQHCWLTNDLATSSKPWKFLVMHVPLANSGYHRSDDDDNNGVPDRLELQEWVLPVAQRYGVQIIFSGNDHDYERSNPMGGVYQIVTGGGGGRLPDYGFPDGRDAANSQFYLVSEFVRVAVQGDSLLLQAIGTNGGVFDSMTIQRRPPPPQEYNATWHTPLVESTPANDGYGNINGQTFDFAGTPIPAMAGNWANLGRIYINNDATNLFLGLEQTMVYSNQTVFLFLELPGQNGATNLVGLGDGLAGTGEGVDGLDFLENLSFTNFAPSVACLLGDEQGDVPDRHLVRPGLGWASGQGVFRLDTNFSDVSGIRLQQFNRSPQVLEPPLQLQYPERNANFIEVAIPIDQLGGLRPGDAIKVAAVVGRAGCDTNAQTRELDTGFLGSSMSGFGQSNVVLGAVSVRLAPAVLTVKADDQARAYGATNAPLTGTYSGFLDGEDVAVLSGSPVLGTDANTNSPVGAYPITATAGTLSNAHYSFSFVVGTLTVTQAVLTVQADDLARVYGAANPPLTASCFGFVNGHDTNILSGSAEMSTPADTNSAVGVYPVMVGPGTLSAADTNYSFRLLQGTLTVTQAVLSVTANSQVRGYGSPNPVFTGTVAGIQNGDVLTVDYQTEAGPASPVGNYTIVPTLSGAAWNNYAVTTNTGTLTVTQTVLIAKADDQTRGYGAANPPLTLSYIGFVNGQDTNILSGSVGLSTVAETNSPVEVYAITISPGTLSVADTNYNLVFVEGTLSVTQAVLTVKADDQARVYGATNPPLTATSSGFVNGHDTNILSGSVELSTLAETKSPAGLYAITVSQGTLSVADTNYRLALIEGILTVTQAVLIVTADDQMRSYGTTNPVLTGNVVGIQDGDTLTVEYQTEAVPASPVGSYEIAPALSGAALSNYAVTTNMGTLTVTQAVLSVTANSQLRGYGATNPVLTGTVLGIQNGDTLTVECQTEAGPASPVGNYEIVPTLSGTALGNYAVTTNAGTLTVTQAVLTVKADEQARAYGLTNPPLTVSYIGFVNGQDTNILSGNAELSTSAETNSPVGIYAISVSQGTLRVTDTNYNLGLSDGALTVTQAVLTVKADDQARVYGGTNPVLTVSYVDFVSGQHTNLLNGSPEVSTGAEGNSPVGAYAITVSQGSLTVTDTNYSLALIEGILTVTQAVLTVTAHDQARTYGATNPAFTGTVVGIQHGDAILASYETTAGTNSPVGYYEIVPGLSGEALSNYLVVTNTGTLTVTLAVLSVTAHDKVRSYGAADPVFTGTIEGLQNEDTITATYITEAGPASAVGTYVIWPNLWGAALDNYAMTLNNGTLTITQAILTVKAEDQARAYGAANAPLTVSYSGFVNGQGTNILSGNPELSTEAETNSAAGVYAIRVGPGTLSVTDASYIPAFVEGTLTVTQACSSNILVSYQNPSTNGDSVTFAAAVSPVEPATTTPTGYVRFLASGTEFGTVALSGSVASISAAFWTLGTNEVRAEYSGDSNFLGSSNIVHQIVLAPCSKTNCCLSIGRNVGGAITLMLLGTTNAQYYLLETTNLAGGITNWMVAADSTNTATNGVWYYTVTNLGGPGDALNRFFRAGSVSPCQ